MNAKKDGNHIRVYEAYSIKESIKEICGRYYDSDNKAWVVPYSKENVALLGLLGVTIDDELAVEINEEAAPDETAILPMPIKATPYHHQIRAYNFALGLFGLGGTA